MSLDLLLLDEKDQSTIVEFIDSKICWKNEQYTSSATLKLSPLIATTRCQTIHTLLDLWTLLKLSKLLKKTVLSSLKNSEYTIIQCFKILQEPTFTCSMSWGKFYKFKAQIWMTQNRMRRLYCSFCYTSE